MEIVGSQEYAIKLNFEHDDIPEGTTINVVLRDSL